MRFTTAFLYGLLAVTQALPTSQDHEHDTKALQRRVGTPPLRPVHVPDGPAPAPPPPPPPPPIGRPRPVTDPAVPSPADPPRLGVRPDPPTLPPTKPNGSPKDSTLNQNYDSKIDNYYLDTKVEPLKLSVSREGRTWFKDNGIDAGDAFGGGGPAAAQVKIYGAPKDVAQSKGLPTIWEGQVDAAHGVMIRSRQFRSGTFQGKNIDDLYPNIPKEDRIFMSEHLAKTWKDYGNGQPLKKLGVTDIDNEAMKPKLKAAVGDQNSADFGPGTQVYDDIMNGSVGKPLQQAIKDSPDIIQTNPTKVSVFHDKSSDSIYSIINLE